MMCVEILIALVGPYEFLNGRKLFYYSTMYKVQYSYEVNEVLTLLTFFKGFFFLRALMYFTRYTNPRSQRVC